MQHNAVQPGTYLAPKPPLPMPCPTVLQARDQCAAQRLPARLRVPGALLHAHRLHLLPAGKCFSCLLLIELGWQGMLVLLLHVHRCRSHHSCRQARWSRQQQHNPYAPCSPCLLPRSTARRAGGGSHLRSGPRRAPTCARCDAAVGGREHCPGLCPPPTQWLPINSGLLSARLLQLPAIGCCLPCPTGCLNWLFVDLATHPCPFHL